MTLATTFAFYRQNPLQAFFVLIGLVLGCGLYTAVAQINASAEASYAQADQILGASAQWRITDRVTGDIAIDDYVWLRRAGFTQVYPVIEKRLINIDGALISIIATDLLALPLTGADAGSTGDRTFGESPFGGSDWSRLTQPPYEAWIPIQTAQRLGVTAGQQVRLLDGTVLPPAVIRSQPQQRDQIFIDLGAALSIFETDRVSYLAAPTLKPNEQARFTDQFGDRLVLSNQSEAVDLTQLTRSLHTNLTALGLLSFVVGTFIVFNAVSFSLHARQQTFRVLRDLGAVRHAIIVAITVESFVWAFTGALLGTLIAQPLSAALMPAVAATIQNIYGASVSSLPVFNAELFLEALLLALSGLVLALALPLLRRTNVSSNDSNAWVGILLSRRDMVLASVGMLMFLLTYLCYPMASSVVHGFALLALVLFAGIALLPAFVLAAAALCRSAVKRHWLARWVFADISFQFPHLRLAMMALLLTLIANIGVTSLVGSFRLALTDWLETRLSADFYVTAGVMDAASLVGEEWVHKAHRRVVAETSFSGRATMVVGIDIDAPDFRSDNVIDAGPDAFVEWSAGGIETERVFANEQLRYLAGIDVGDTIALDTELGQRLFEVLGFFHDYGNVNFAVYLPMGRFEQLYSSAKPQGWGIWISSDKQEAAELGLSKLGLEPTQWFSQRDVLALSLAVFDRTFAITRALNTLTLLVAAIAIFASLLAVYQFRRPEYALWRSLGVNWPAFFALSGLPIVLMTAVVMVLALPLGIVLSWLLIHKINVISFGWTMPVIVAMKPIIFLFFVVAAVVLSAFILASIRQRAAVSKALKSLAGE
ncbi:MAG: FtsX-like permease family protein [Pseudomonadota bacterium]|nr:FtsX-like permease family protein [Pseudomonadota bacterium]